MGHRYLTVVSSSGFFWHLVKCSWDRMWWRDSKRGVCSSEALDAVECDWYLLEIVGSHLFVESSRCC